MSSFWKLCVGETKKIWAKKSSWIMGIILAALILLLTLLVWALGDNAKMFLNLANSGTQSLTMSMTEQQLSDALPDSLYLAAAKRLLPELEEQLDNQKEQLQELSGTERAVYFLGVVAPLERQIQIVRYRVDHSLAEKETSLCWPFVTLAGTLCISLISLFALIVGAGSVAGEYTDGTMKLLIPRPYKRWKILLAKLLATIGYAVLLLLIGYVVALLCGGILFGFEGAGALVVGSNGTAAYAVPAFLHSLMLYFLGTPGLLVTISLAFMLSCLIRSRAVAVGVSMLVSLVGGNIITLLSLFGAGWVKYTVFVNMDLSTYYTQGIVIEGTSVLFTLLMMAAYLILFLFIAFFTFQKRDI